MADQTLDVIGLLCPLPVLKAQKALKALDGGAVLEVRATDPATAIDIPHFCAETGHTLVESQQDGDVLIFRIEKKA